MVAVNKILNNKVSKTEAALSIILLIMLVYGLATALYYVIAVDNNNTPAPVHYYSPPTYHLGSPVRSRYMDTEYDITNGVPAPAPVNEHLNNRYNDTEVLDDKKFICCMKGCDNCNAESLNCLHNTEEQCTSNGGEWCSWPDSYKQDNIDDGAFCTKNIGSESCSVDNAEKHHACSLSNPLSLKSCIEDTDNIWCDAKK